LRTMSDAALMLAAYERWETDAFDRICGNYTCAVWDGASRRLLLAKDAIGMQPLYYHRAAGLLAFASMPKGLHALPEVDYTPDEDRIAEFLTLTPEWGTETFFKG